MKLRVIQDIEIFGKIIFKQGDVIERSESYSIQHNGEQIKIPHSLIENFLEKQDTISISMKPIDDDDKERIWRMQLDVKTTRTKAIEIEKKLREILEDMI